jgi:hypothetical protein
VQSFVSQCDNYCNVLESACSGDNSQFKDRSACMSSCQYYPANAAETSTSDDSLQCRRNRAELAQINPSVHCANAGPTGGGVCGTGCSFYCEVTQAACSTDTTRLYPNAGACNAACVAASWTDAEGNTVSAGNDDKPWTHLTGNSLACRTNHALLAGAGSADFHCPHASDASAAGVCAEPPASDPSKLANAISADQLPAGTALSWTLDGDTVTLKVSAPPSGWLAVGFSDGDSMVNGASPTTAVIYNTGDSSVSEKRLDGKQAGAFVTLPGQSHLTVLQKTATDTETTLEFTRTLTAEGGRTIDPAAQWLLVARGPLQDGNGLLYHSERRGVKANLASGTSVAGNDPISTGLVKAHAVMMALSWGFCLPVGVLIAMLGRNWEPKGTWYGRFGRCAPHHDVRARAMCMCAWRYPILTPPIPPRPTSTAPPAAAPPAATALTRTPPPPGSCGTSACRSPASCSPPSASP